jgi:hypothetical protein
MLKGLYIKNKNIIVKPSPLLDSSTPLNDITMPSDDYFEIDYEVCVPFLYKFITCTFRVCQLKIIN